MYWTYDNKFFDALGTKKKISGSSDYVIPTSIAVCLFEILIQDRDELVKTFNSQDIEKWKSAVNKAYDYLFGAFQINKQKPEEEKVRKLHESFYNTCVFLCNEFKLIK